MAFIFLKRDVNIKLVLIIVVLVAAIAVFSAFYQTKFKNISIDYENKTKQLEKITAKAVFGEKIFFDSAGTFYQMKTFGIPKKWKRNSANQKRCGDNQKKSDFGVIFSLHRVP